jgi:tetratricopeptide (TPR) repeat protein
MLSRIYLFLILILFLGGGFLYFSSNSSYKDSFQARIYYFLGNYKQAYEYANKAYKQDGYNKMAFTVLTQSKIAKSYEKYIVQGNKYLEKIDSISTKKIFSSADRIRIKMMCEVMIDSYGELSPTKLTDITLQENAKKIHLKFKKLYAQLF